MVVIKKSRFGVEHLVFAQNLCFAKTAHQVFDKMIQGKMDHQRNQAALKGKEKVRAPPTRMSLRLAALRAPQSPLLKMRTPTSRASPRLAALKDSLLPPSPTFVLIHYKTRQYYQRPYRRPSRW
ncbi:hypothetical protein PIB30_071946 [Stylosanthes scabra]|uniref:Uncharacterized protein n=1 Tax=Stylosanthes scabra TaxID=79078 RepID=A0ABU6TNL6_9FABA|nr:hypothetical protein [Stylosanthes scabra]